MAKTGYVCLCFLVVLATFSQCGLGAGTIHVVNAADNDFARQSTFNFSDGPPVTADLTVQATGTTEVY